MNGNNKPPDAAKAQKGKKVVEKSEKKPPAAAPAAKTNNVTVRQNDKSRAPAAPPKPASVPTPAAEASATSFHPSSKTVSVPASSAGSGSTKLAGASSALAGVSPVASSNDRLMKSEVESLNSRLHKYNDENDELLDRLSDAKRKYEKREREFEEERQHLYHRIGELETMYMENMEQLECAKDDKEIIDVLDRKVFQLKEQLKNSDKIIAEKEAKERDMREMVSMIAEQLEVKAKESADKEAELRIAEQRKELLDALNKENERLRNELEENYNLIQEMNTEKEQLMTHSTANDREQELKQEIKNLKHNLEKESKKVAELEAEKKSSADDGKRINQKNEIETLKEKLREKENQLEVKMLAMQELESIKEDLQKIYIKREVEYKQQIETLSKALDESKDGNRAESFNNDMERLQENLKLTENALHEKMRIQQVEHDLELEKLKASFERELKDQLSSKELQQTTKDFELKEKILQETIKKKDVEITILNSKLTKATNDIKNLAEEANRKEKLCSALREELERCRRELQSKEPVQSDKFDFLSNPDPTDIKNAKLERAILRLKLENDQLKTRRSDDRLDTLMYEKESHINDLRREVSTLRKALKDLPSQLDTSRWKQPPNQEENGNINNKISKEKYDDILTSHRRLLEETARLRAAQEVSEERHTQRNQPRLKAELDEAKRKLAASTERIAKLEGWLDDIYNTDTEIGVGKRTYSKNEKVGASSPRRNSLSLPDLDRKIKQTKQSIRLSKPKEKPSWNFEKRP